MRTLLPRDSRFFALAALAFALAAPAITLTAPARADAASAQAAVSDVSGETLEEEPEEPAAICGPIPLLSPIGAAINAVAPKSRTTCVGMANPWLHNIDSVRARGTHFRAIGVEFLKTQNNFAHASLYYHSSYNFPQLLKDLHDKLAGPGGVLLPPEKRPLIRFMFGDPSVGVTSDNLYATLVAALPKTFSAPDPTKWNVRVAVLNADSPSGWNHTKLNIRDGFAVLASSVETTQHELGVHVAGSRPGQLARDWFDEIWRSYWSGFCAGSDRTACTDVPKLVPPIAAEPDYGFRAVNAFALKRGWRPGLGFDEEADRALFAGMRASQESVFFLNPGLTNGSRPFKGEYSRILLDEIAERLIDDVDVKFLWGDRYAQPRDDSWKEIESHIFDRLSGLGPRERQSAYCKFHVADFPQLRDMAGGSHAKLYMLDHGGFYVGSQNMYPSGIRSDLSFMGFEIPELDEFGYYFDAVGRNKDLADEVVRRVVSPAWGVSAPVADPGDTCADVHNPVRLAAATTGAPPIHSCAGDLDAVLDYRTVTYDESAKLKVRGTCQSDLGPVVQIQIDGSVGTDRKIRGTITGIAGGISDTAVLQGTVSRGKFDLRFADLELSTNTTYSGTIVSR